MNLLIIAFFTLYGVLQASINIFDLTNNPLAIVPLGQAKIRIGYLRTIHPIDLTELEEIISRVFENSTNSTGKSPLQSLINLKLEKLNATISKIRPRRLRTKRWNSIGTAWKWIAGSPDAEDLTIINTTLNSLILQNNEQLLINNGLSRRFQETTHIANHVIDLQNRIQREHQTEIQQIIKIANLDALQAHIKTLQEAILAAKHGIPNSELLSIEDLNTVAEFLAQNGIYYTSVEEMLTQATAQVTMNSTHVIFMLKFPRLSYENYEYNYIDSIIQNDKRILIKHNYIIRNLTHMFELPQPCIDQSSHQLCESKDLEEPSRCIRQLVQGEHTECMYEKVYSTGLVKHINNANILLNDATAEISSNCSNINHILNGSYLIRFHNCNIFINGELFPSTEVSITGKPYISTLGLIAKEDGIRDEPSIEHLRNITLQHREKLHTISLVNNSLTWKLHIFGSIGLTTIVLITIAILYFITSIRRTKISLNIPTNNTNRQDVHHIETFVKKPITFHALGRL
ncbi:uncharacterized protein LOC121595976 [Anopheles merus]|uniref:uncharacterized protein LOC121595976 n=1 Tax=Anopheles merus TaxID=30066 RepID=UPI001BE3E406|nr:uncharacterized protein LOC121595976 [Anopheles merus]